MQYSIWVIPSEPVYSRLKNIIDRLSMEYSGPVFEPHMTILGNIDKDLTVVEQKVKELANSVDKLELSLGPVSFSTTYFQSVFVRVNSTAKLMQLNLDAKKLFDMENTVFMPHISLLYGDHGMVAREKAASKVRLLPSSFAVNQFIITPATSDPSEWKHSVTVPFSLRIDRS